MQAPAPARRASTTSRHVPAAVAVEFLQLLRVRQHRWSPQLAPVEDEAAGGDDLGHLAAASQMAVRSNTNRP